MDKYIKVQDVLDFLKEKESVYTRSYRQCIKRDNEHGILGNRARIRLCADLQEIIKTSVYDTPSDFYKENFETVNVPTQEEIDDDTATWAFSGSNDYGSLYTCSNCGQGTLGVVMFGRVLMDYCPHCGKRMKRVVLNQEIEQEKK